MRPGLLPVYASIRFRFRRSRPPAGAPIVGGTIGLGGIPAVPVPVVRPAGWPAVFDPLAALVLVSAAGVNVLAFAPSARPDTSEAVRNPVVLFPAVG